MKGFGLIEDQVFTMHEDRSVPNEKFKLGKLLG